MSDFDRNSLHEELEARVISLLAGELSEAEADELEKILAINPDLTAFRDRMAGLMGELHQSRDELVESGGEPRHLSEERRARIFGDPAVLQEVVRVKRSRWKATIWGIAAAICMLFFLTALLIPAFQKVRYATAMNQVDSHFDASGMGKPSPEYEARLYSEGDSNGRSFGSYASGGDEMLERSIVPESAPSPAPPVLVSPSDIAIPTLEDEDNLDSSTVYARGGGGFGGDKNGLREMTETESGERVAVVPAGPPAPAEAKAPDYGDFGYANSSVVVTGVESTRRDVSKSMASREAGGDELYRSGESYNRGRSKQLVDGFEDGSESRHEDEGRFRGELFNGRQSAKVASGRTIPVDIPDEMIEGTPQPIVVPVLEATPSSAPRMVVVEDALTTLNWSAGDDFSEADNKPTGELRKDIGGGVGGSGVAKSASGVVVDAKGNADLYADHIGGNISGDISYYQVVEAEEEQEARGVASTGPVDAFAAPVVNEVPVVGGLFKGKKTRESLKEEKALQLGLDTIAAEETDLSYAYDGAVPAGNGQLAQLDDKESGKAGNVIAQSIPKPQPVKKQKAKDKLAEAIRLTPKPEKLAAEEPFSTFSLNISDVSFKLAQAALQNSTVPSSTQIRTEEFVNSFDYGDPVPRADQPVSLNWEIAQHPFEHDRQVVRFSLQTQASGRSAGQPLNISLLVDNSGSMQRPDRQAILQNSLQTLEQKLTPQDKLNVILFARQPRLIAEAHTRAGQKAAVETALAYRPEGGTNIEAGLMAAYESAQRNYLPTGGNRVILMTDGAANLGNVNAGDLAEFVVNQRKQGIALDAYGIGWDDYNDALLEEITRNGDGRYAFLNSIEDASEDFSEKLAGTLRVAAADVKVQIEWNPARVKRYRQVGYDLHQLKKEDFRDNTVDAAEIGEAESGTALYVLKIDEDPDIIGGLGTLNVRYRDPASGLYRELSWPLPMPHRVQDASTASPSMRLALSSAFFGERLAGSPYAQGYSFHDLYSMTAGLPEAFPNQPRVAQMQAMLLQAGELFRETK